MTPMLKDKNNKSIDVLLIKKLKLKRGGSNFLETLPWYFDGKDWFVEKELIKDYIKGE